MCIRDRTELVPGADGPLSSATHHRLMFKSVRHRLERSHPAATEGGGHAYELGVGPVPVRRGVLPSQSLPNINTQIHNP